MKMVKVLVASALMALTLQAAQAKQVAGVEIPDTATVAGQTLKLNGTAIRTKLVFKVYAAGLYLAQPSSDAAAIMSGQDKKPKRIQLTLLREVDSKSFIEAVTKNIDENFSADDKKKFANELSEFVGLFKTADKVKSGDIITIDYLPGVGTQLTLSGKTLDVIPGDAFYHALLRLWIGKPPQESMKNGLLGK